jgi:hypothetical protein
MSDLVVFIGVQGSGKGYQCGVLKKENYVQVDFADELRGIAWDTLGWCPRPECFDRDYEWFKKLRLDYIHLIHTHSDEELDWYFQVKQEHDIKEDGFIMTGRLFLLNLGTPAIRSRHPDFWINSWNYKVMRLLNEKYRVCTSDCRFLNELIICHELGARFIFCNYKSERYNSEYIHESEKLAQFFLKKGSRNYY